jgi:hypothetical protein
LPTKQQIVRVYNPYGQFIDVWRDAPLLSGFKEAVNSATTPLRIKLSRSFDSFDEIYTPGARGTIGQGNQVEFWLYGPGIPNIGLLRYQGIIDAYEPSIDADGEESLVVTLVPQGMVVGDQGITSAVAFGTPGISSTYIDPLAMFAYWFTTTDSITGSPYASPLIRDPGNPTASGIAKQYTFVNQKLIDIWNTILTLLPIGWFWRINPDNSVTFTLSPTTPQHTFILGQHCSMIAYKKDWGGIKNAVYVKGNGVSSLRTGSDIVVFGKRLLMVQESRISDSDTCSTYAQSLLNIYDRVRYRAQIRVVDYRGDSNQSIGYDIESIRVGQTCRIINPCSSNNLTQWDAATWDTSPWDMAPGADLSQVSVIVGLSYHFDYVDLELSDLAPSQDISFAYFQQTLNKHVLG